MAWYTGNCATDGAGELITLLDTELVKNANWTIHDAAAGTNAKVYKNTNAMKDFYLYVDDNQAQDAKIEIYAAWDAGTHTGSGNSITGGYIKKALDYGIHLDDDCFYLVFIGDKKTYFIGAITSRNAAKRLICAIVRNNTYTHYPNVNPVGTAIVNGSMAKCLADENGSANDIAVIGSLQLKDINGAPNFQELVIKNSATGLIMGTISGLTNGSSSTNEAVFANGDITTITGVEWAFCMYQSGTANFGANWYRKS